MTDHQQPATEAPRLSAEDEASLRSKHRKGDVAFFGECVGCSAGHPIKSPCMVERAITELDATRQDLAAATARSEAAELERDDAAAASTEFITAGVHLQEDLAAERERNAPLRAR